MALTTTPADAANWLLLQGTQAEARAATEPWGFFQPEMQHTADGSLAAGAWEGQSAAFNQVRPRLAKSTRVNVIRARLGLRGRLCVVSCDVHYFLLGEFGYNGLTKRSSDASWSPQITDYSLTFNYFPGARIRLGQFKTPVGEEGLQAIHAFNYVNFSSITERLTNERFFRSDGSGTPANGAAGTGNPNEPRIAAFRDIGIEVFDAFRLGGADTPNPWELSYALMVGNGNGLTRWDNDHRKDIYAFGSAERITRGKGPRQEGLKLYAWHQYGRRKLTGEGRGVYDRQRWGGGAVLRDGPWRLGFEYIGAAGMIFAGTDGGAVPGSRSNSTLGVASFNVQPKERAWGWYVDLGYRPHPIIEFDLRFDQLHSGTRSAANERRFDTLTLGVQFIAPKRIGFLRNLRALVNYEFRWAKAPDLPDSSPPNLILKGLDPRLSVQMIAIF